MIKGIIFDMDGVLIDTEKLYNRFWCEAAAIFGYDMKREHALMIRSTSAPVAIPMLEEKLGRGFPYYEVKKKRIEIMNEYIDKNGVEVKKGAHELLDYLKENGIKAAVATSSDMERTNKYLTMAGLYGKFDCYVSGVNVARSKPFPDIYIEAAKQLGLDTKDCFAVEDSPSGVKSAYAAGCKTIIVPDLDEPDEDMRSKAYAICESLDKILDLIK